MKNTLEIIKDTSIIMLSITMAFVLTRLDFSGISSGQGSVEAAPEGPAVGDNVSCFKGYLDANVPQHLILLISPDCHFCKESMPFFKKLVAADERASHIQIHFAIDDQGDEYEPTLAILQQAGIGQDVPVIPVDRRACELYYSPMILLLNKDADLVALETGKLDVQGEERLLALF